MKRLIIMGMFCVSFLMQADDVAANNTTDNQSTSGKSIDSSAITIANIHHINLDTTEVDGGGNWLNKRMWYERAQKVFDEIRMSISSVNDLRVQFIDQEHQIARKIDSFFEVVTFKYGELYATFQEMLATLETQQKIIGDLSVEERNLQVKVKQELTVVEQIEKDMKSIGQIDNKIQETMDQAFKTVGECLDYENRAWQAFKSIGKELDDKKARNLYYQMNNYKQNLDQKITYLKTMLLPYMQRELGSKIDTSIAKINTAIEHLKAKGLDLEKIMHKVQEDDQATLHEHKKSAVDIAVKKAVDEVLEKEKVKDKQEQDAFIEQLKGAQEQSFSAVMHRYYQATLGKVVNFIHSGYMGQGIDAVSSFFTSFFKSYSYPVLTYGMHAVHHIKMYMEIWMIKVMSVFGVHPKPQKVAEKIVEKINQSPVAEQIKELVQEKIAEKIGQPSVDNSDQQNTPASDNQASAQVVDNSVSQNDQNATQTPEKIQAQPDEAKPEEQALAAPVSQVTPPVSVAPATTSDNVAVQSLSLSMQDETARQPHALYALFKEILDFIGTIVMSLYRCATQFFVVLYKFVSYLGSFN